MYLKFVKIGLLGVDTLLLARLPCLVGFLKDVSGNLLQSPRHDGLNVLHSSRMLSFQTGFGPGTQKEVCMSQVRTVGWLGHRCSVVLDHWLLQAQWRVTRRIIVAAISVDPFFQHLEHFHVECRIDDLSGWYKLLMDHISAVWWASRPLFVFAVFPAVLKHLEPLQTLRFR